MSGQGYPDHSPTAADSLATHTEEGRPSRRTVLRRGAIAGTVGLALAAGGGTAVAAVMSSQSKAGPAATSPSDAGSAGPIVVYLADPRSGEMEIFSGTSKTRHTDRAMASMVASMAPR